MELYGRLVVIQEVNLPAHRFHNDLMKAHLSDSQLIPRWGEKFRLL